MKKVVIHSDGGCLGNPGPGGWAATLEYGSHRREISGGEAATTNNRMELLAAIQALNTLKEPCAVDLFTDSKYLLNGVTTWMKNWKRKGWRKSAKEPLKNKDLWRALDAATLKHKIQWHWLKGHAGHAANERCDELANQAIEQIKRTHTPQQLQAALDLFLRSIRETDSVGQLFSGAPSGQSTLPTARTLMAESSPPPR